MSDFDSMQTTIVGNIISVSSYDVSSDVRGGFLWLTKPNNGKREDVLGLQIIKISMPFEMFAKFKAENYEFPALYEILADVEMGSGNKATFKAVSVRKHVPDVPKSGNKPASSKAA